MQLRLLPCVFAMVMVPLTSSAMAHDQKCPGEGKLRSKNSRTPTVMKFQNDSGTDVQIYWLDFKGKRVPYNTLSPGQSYTQQTFVSHPWVAVAASGKCFGPFMPKRQDVNVIAP